MKSTQFDFSSPVILGDRIDDVPGDIGYDHNFCFGSPGERKHIARYVLSRTL